MNNYHIIISFLIILFYWRCNTFIDLKGMDYPLLRVLLELILITFLLVAFKYKEELKEMTQFDKFQKKIEDYFNKTD